MSLTVADSMSDAHEGIGRISGIPVRNLWLLMWYASGLFREHEKAKVAVEDNPDDIPDLVAEMLCHLAAFSLADIQNVTRARR